MSVSGVPAQDRRMTSSGAFRAAVLACVGMVAINTVRSQTTQIGQFTGMVSTYNEGDKDPCIGSGKNDDVRRSLPQ